ncbi:MAG: class I SAM-dependent methyltransferase [Verrucomicrobia bacterium]|nr:class I SAM-dependent methyltransferase [Verrucomicrobiota bacterium]
MNLIVFEDEHLLVVNKPAGWNTHSPSPYAGEGIYEWLKHREPRWAKLAIIHRLDKETSGLIVFGKTASANRSLSAQFENRSVQKTYVLLTDHPVAFQNLAVNSKIARSGAQYASGSQGEPAETRFRLLGTYENGNLLEAQPVTGRTHQIRVHAAENGFPILGDALYGGKTFSRVCLHARELRLKHPETQHDLTFSAELKFEDDARLALRQVLIDEQETNAFRLIHGAADGWPGWYVEKLGDFLLSQSEQPLSEVQKDFLQKHLSGSERPLRGVYHKTLSRHIRGAAIQQTSPDLVLGEPVPVEFSVCENGMNFAMRFNEGYSVGLFLDQRDNRRRFLTNHIAAQFPLFASPAKAEVLNTFSYTCGFSVAAAQAGARVTSLDLSKKYLEWGRRNFALNNLDPAQHDFIFGDTFDWLHRMAKKKRSFDAIILDPPTFSQSKESGVFRADKDYGELVQAAVGVLKPSGVLFCSTNAAELKPETFWEMINAGVLSMKRKIQQQHYVPQPPDFPITREEPSYLKTVWLRVA